MTMRRTVCGLLALGLQSSACSSSMDLGAVDEFPGAGAANGWQTSDGQAIDSMVFLQQHAYDIATYNGRLTFTADALNLYTEPPSGAPSSVMGCCRSPETA